jgi:hypothetical protein
VKQVQGARWANKSGLGRDSVVLAASLQCAATCWNSAWRWEDAVVFCLGCCSQQFRVLSKAAAAEQDSARRSLLSCTSAFAFEESKGSCRGKEAPFSKHTHMCHFFYPDLRPPCHPDLGAHQKGSTDAVSRSVHHVAEQALGQTLFGPCSALSLMVFLGNGPMAIIAAFCHSHLLCPCPSLSVSCMTVVSLSPFCSSSW